MLQQVVDAVVRARTDVRWGVCVQDAASGRVLAERHGHDPLPVASLGKLLLLVAVARGLADGSLDGREPLSRSAVPPVGDSGLWQHWTVGSLPMADVAALVGAVSDNLATNVLLDRLGRAPVDEVCHDLGLRRTRLLDRVRDVRGPGDPPTLSTGCATELAGLLARLHRGEPSGRAAADLVLGWLRAGVDLSLVASAWGLDPLAHATGDRGVRPAVKTGADPGVRAEAGLLEGRRWALAYAVLAGWDPAEDRRDDVLAGMRRLGAALWQQAHRPA